MYSTVDLVYWQAKQNGIEPSIVNERTITEPRFQWNPGFRIGLGTSIGHDKWDLGLLLTHIHLKAFVSKTAPLISPIWSVTDETVQQMSQYWRLHLGLLDLDLTKHFQLSKALVFQLGLSVRGAMIRQKIQTLYAVPIEEDEMSAKNKFWGIGPGFKARSAWEIWKGGGIYAAGCFALLQGQFYVHQDEDTASTDFLKVFNIYPSLASTAQLGLGLEQKWHFTRSSFLVALGWEELFFAAQNRFLHFLSQTKTAAFAANQGDLTLQGLTLRFSASF